MGKAGAYAVQGMGGTLVDRIEGELSTIVGLTLSATARLLTQAGVSHALA
jgi:septum formation protein